MNYSKKSTSRKQKALKGKGTKMGKKLGVVFMKTLLVLIIALGVAGLCGGIGIIKGVMENAPDESGLEKNDYMDWLSEKIVSNKSPDVFIVPVSDQSDAFACRNCSYRCYCRI